MDFREVATATEGYSGADLQALVYNAHLEVIHASIASVSESPVSQSTTDEEPIDFVSFGGPPLNKVASKAEQMALQKRVTKCTPYDLPSLLINLPIAATDPLDNTNRPRRSKIAIPNPCKGMQCFHDFQLLANSLQHNITIDHIRRVLKTTRPSVSPEERGRLDRM